jgi:hypothetical protein
VRLPVAHVDLGVVQDAPGRPAGLIHAHLDIGLVVLVAVRNGARVGAGQREQPRGSIERCDRIQVKLNEPVSAAYAAAEAGPVMTATGSTSAESVRRRRRIGGSPALGLARPWSAAQPGFLEGWHRSGRGHEQLAAHALSLVDQSGSAETGTIVDGTVSRHPNAGMSPVPGETLRLGWPVDPHPQRAMGSRGADCIRRPRRPAPAPAERTRPSTRPRCGRAGRATRRPRAARVQARRAALPWFVRPTTHRPRRPGS